MSKDEKKDRETERKARLAAELRANLARRKQQSRSRRADQKPVASDGKSGKRKPSPR